MILAADIGGTKTLIGLFDFAAPRPAAIDVQSFPTTAFAGIGAIVEAFLAKQPQRPPIESAAFGVAGPVINQRAQMTNVEWAVDAGELRSGFGFRHVRLLNDLEAMAYGVPALNATEVRVLQEGTTKEQSNIALIAAGTGLGQAVLHYVGGGYTPLPSEGGHSDFAARTDRELDLVRYLTRQYGRAEIEHVLCGRGLVNLSDFTHQAAGCEDPASGGKPPDMPATVSALGLARSCRHCVEALDMFVEAYGAAAGNLALTAVTRGGVFVGGGIAPKILPALENGLFVKAFNAKEPMREMLEGMPVRVILNPQTALLGAAVYASANA
jgi:glucokinase